MKHTSTLMIIMLSLILFLLQACSSSPTPEPTQPPLSENGGSQPMPVEEFVRQVFIGGVPYEETLKNYDAADVPVLLAMLNDPTEMAHWANIVVVLNIVGDEEVVEPIITFINEGGEGELSYPHYTAKTSALLSVGYLINRTGSEEALAYLIDSLDPAVWEERGTTGIGPFQNTLEETHRELSKNAILGLALSGNPEAAEALRSFQELETTGEQAIFQSEVMELVQEALATNEEIANEGLVNYYRNAGP